MIRTLAAAAVLAVSSPVISQTIMSVQDGAWTDPATWDCTCVPPIPSNVFVMHHVTFSGPLGFGPMLFVGPPGHLEQLSPGYIYCNPGGGLEVNGVLSTTNYLATGCPLLITGTVMAGGGLYAGLGVQLDGGTLLVTGNFSNGVGSAIDGMGQICITDSSNIQGPLTGSIDLCDLTPTTTTPPFVDGGATFVAPTITFCQNSLCATGVKEGDTVLDVEAFPVPASNELTLTGAFHGKAELLLHNAVGELVQVPAHRQVDGRIVLQIDALAQGLYLIEIRNNGLRGVVRFVKE
ncbi:MAG: T9SS type A sorting domain-containing protein [Flavobacteriales bacterium]|nr:T9SS type A sorting domain-containing protein [Flavobacteriales bacterium]